MGTNLQQVLRSLCLNTDWNYAVFWKLKRRSRMVLTWEDAYYDNSEPSNPSDANCLIQKANRSHDALGLAIAKMSYHVYSLGEGIVGQVAVSGKHQWIFADKHVTDSRASFEIRDGWESQFSAGVKTIVVVAVVPHGVVQFGSLKEITEDVKLVTHIRDVFFTIRETSIGVTNFVEQTMKSSSSLPSYPDKGLVSGVVIPDCLHIVNKTNNKELPNAISVSSSYPLSGTYPRNDMEVVNKNERTEFSTLGTDGSRSYQKNVAIANDNGLSEGETSGWKDIVVQPEDDSNPDPNSSFMNSMNPYDFALKDETPEIPPQCFASNILESVFCDTMKIDVMDSQLNGVPYIPDTSGLKSQKDLEKKLENQIEVNPMKTWNHPSPQKFSTGCELLEALGPAFLNKTDYFDWEMVEKTDNGDNIQMLEGMSESQLTFDSGQENLLEAVVANVCRTVGDCKSETSFSRSLQSLLTSDRKAVEDLSSHTKHTASSTGCSINQSSLLKSDTPQTSSEIYGALSSKGFSSNCPSICSDQFEKSTDIVRNSKKRARPGENCRPRPRDRQLIQDRIKELRDLVPNGSKCSIDSLLERTIKHMLFLQSITKHSEKLSKCAKSKMHDNGSGMLGSSNYEQGSSWAVEVGSHLKVCSIVVENLNKNGQMLVEMVCEECSHFLEIAEAIKSLGLTILKGVTEAHGEKTWICFMVEGQTNKAMHRMDILWSLVQILQPKATTTTT